MSDRLKAGDPHYRAYVGPPHQYDFMGATQFRLLTALGLRDPVFKNSRKPWKADP